MSSQEISEKSSRTERTGRWTKDECRLFQQLIENYGKDWKKIHAFIPQRSLAQLRSHGQKFFSRAGKQKLREYERKAKLLAAMQILKNDNMEEQFERFCRQIPQKTAPPPRQSPTLETPPQIKSEDIFEGQSNAKKTVKAESGLRDGESIEAASKTESMLYPFYQSKPEILAKMQYPIPQDILDSNGSLLGQKDNPNCFFTQ